MKTAYKDLPKRMREEYDRLGLRDGFTPTETLSTGEQYYIKKLKEKSQYKRSLFETKTRKEIDAYLSRISLDLMDIADYLEIIDSPYADEASNIEGAFRNFSCRFVVFSKTDREFFPDANQEEIDFFGRVINDEQNN